MVRREIAQAQDRVEIYPGQSALTRQQPDGVGFDVRIEYSLYQSYEICSLNSLKLARRDTVVAK